MDHFPRIKRVTGTAERFIQYHGPAKYYVFRNLGPSDITLTFWADPVNGQPITLPVRVGDSAELYCALIEAKLGNNMTDPAILEWTPVG